MKCPFLQDINSDYHIPYTLLYRKSLDFPFKILPKILFILFYMSGSIIDPMKNMQGKIGTHLHFKVICNVI